jgi:hypothetical protein
VRDWCAHGRTSLLDKLFGLLDDRRVRGGIRIAIEANKQVASVSLNNSAQHMVIIIREGIPRKAAGEAVIMAAEDRGPLMHARVGMMQARNVERVSNPDRKDRIWENGS